MTIDFVVVGPCCPSRIKLTGDQQRRLIDQEMNWEPPKEDTFYFYDVKDLQNLLINRMEVNNDE